MFIIFYLIYSLIIPTKVYVNIEKVNPIITHTGITFKNDNEIIRYDFRAFNDNDDFMTTEETRKNMNIMFPNINPKFFRYMGFDEYKEYRKDITLYSEEIYLGETNYSLEEIINYEKCINKFYFLGIHDCRHYVNDLTRWCLNVSIPIWNLKKVKNFNNYQNFKMNF